MTMLEVLKENANILVGAGVSILSIILGFLLNMTYENHREKRKARNDALRNHFVVLESKVIKDIIELMQNIVKDYKGELSIPFYNLDKGDFGIFKLHFADQGEKIRQLMERANTHNKKSKEFDSYLGKLLKEKTSIPLTNGQERPFIYYTVPSYLRDALCQSEHNFSRACVVKEQDFWQVITGVVYAKLTNEKEAENVRNCLIELADSVELRNEVVKIIKDAESVVNDSKSLSGLLEFVCWQYKESGLQLREKKDCPYCQVIFHKK